MCRPQSRPSPPPGAAAPARQTWDTSGAEIVCHQAEFLPGRCNDTLQYNKSPLNKLFSRQRFFLKLKSPFQRMSIVCTVPAKSEQIKRIFTFSQLKYVIVNAV